MGNLTADELEHSLVMREQDNHVYPSAPKTTKLNTRRNTMLSELSENSRSRSLLDNCWDSEHHLLTMLEEDEDEEWSDYEIDLGLNKEEPPTQLRVSAYEDDLSEFSESDFEEITPDSPMSPTPRAESKRTRSDSLASFNRKRKKSVVF